MNQTQTRSLRKKVLSLILAVVMVVSLLPISAFASGNSKASTTDSTDYYKILHLDCGRKYFSKDWIIALLNEMKADGYNQLQLAFGNDGLRFLLDDMSFTANGTTYSHKTVVSKVEAGNKLQNSSGDASWLTQTEMDEIIAAADKLHIEIVPLLNLPGHANAILDIVNNNMYNAKIYGTVSQNTLDVTNDAACNFGYEIFKKYVDYFSSKGCKYFNFGADEYGNDIGDGNPHFNVLKGTGYENLSTFINKLAAYIGSKNMTPRTFNDALYYNKGSWDMQTTTNTAIKTIQCCYWSSGWDSYPVAEASTIVSNGHAMINTNGAYYYVLGKDDAFTPGKTKVHDAGQYTAAAKFDNTAFASGTVNNPVGSMFCIWSDFPNAETETQVAQNVRLVMRAMALRMDGESIDRMDTSVVANGFNADGTLNVGSTGSVTERTITVAVGGTETRTLTGTFASDFSDNIAKVTTENIAASEKKLNPVTAIESGKKYLIVNNRKGTLLTSTSSSDWDGKHSGLKLNGSATADNTADLWTITGKNNNYTVQNTDGKYLTIGANTAAVENDSKTLTLAYTSGGYWNISQDSYYLNHLGTSTTAGGYEKTSSINADTDPGSQWTIYEVTGGEASTKITFKGLAKGDTSVKIGDVTYKIHVVAEDLSKVTPLTIEYWITNRQVTADNATSKTVNATENSIYSEAGVKLSELVPSEGVGEEANSKTVFWKGTRLTTEVGKQNTDKGNDKTTVGDDFTYIRYWESKWAFSADGTKWTAFNSDDQVVAYYLQKTDVTNEVETQVVDWGAKRENYSYNTWVLLDYAVKYESGDRTPDTFPVDSKTLAFHCDYNSTDDINKTVFKDGSTYYRKIGAIRAEETAAGYEVYMITVTPTSDTKTESVASSPVTATEYAYKGTEKVVWVDKETDLGDFADTSKRYEGFSVGGDAVVPGLNIYNQQGMLVTYYVRAKAMPGSLTVHYVDKATGDEFHSYSINVTNTVENQTLFKENIGLADSWKGHLVNGDVVNNVGVKQWVSADLSTMPSIPTKYRYAPNYTCVDVVRSADGKEVTLYYTFKMDKTFVVDFGLPLVIKPTDISANLGSAMLTGVTANSSTQQNYADITSDANCNITYKLTTMLNGADKLDVKYDGRIPVDDGTQTGSVSYEVGIIPASTVYYEDNFVEFSAGWTRAGTTETNAVQQLDELGKTGANNYGYDGQYNSSSKFSLGSAMKTTVSRATNSNPPTATFTFKGTGFDLVSMTSKDTGTILVNVVGKDGAGNDVKKNWIVDTFYGYTRTQNGYIQYNWTKGEDGKWHKKTTTIDALPAGATTGGTPVNSGDVTYELNYIWTPVTDQSNALYQIPVIHYTDLPYGTYTVTITPKYSSARDPYYTADGDNSYDFYLDGVRIYNPAGDTLNDQYVKDHEGYAQFTEIRDMLLSASSLKAAIEPATTGMVFVDGVGDKGTFTDYTNYGPNNEVYLSKGQAIAFTISDMSNVDTIQIGAKAPSGNTTMQIKVDGNDVQTQELTTASDMYYKLDSVKANKTVVITNTSDHLLSLTTLKVTYKTAPTAMNSAEAIVDSDVLAQAPVMLTSMLYGEPQTFEPSRFEANWGRSVRAGQKATLTVKASDDVGAIEVNGVTIDTYRTRTERTGWGWWAKRVTYREFTYTMTAEATADYAVYALNSDGIKSEPTTATLTVKPAINWWHKWF